jgi:hypothetical protein
VLAKALICRIKTANTRGLTVNAMNNLLRWRDENRLLPLLLVASIVLMLAILAAAIWSHGGVAGFERFASAKLLRGAFARVEPGHTTQSQLADMGFDPSRLKAHSLSGLGVQEYFMPRTSAAYDKLDPAIRACFDMPDRCTALVFPLGPAIEKGGFMAAYAAPQDPGQIVFLLKSGRVAFKAMNG